MDPERWNEYADYLIMRSDLGYELWDSIALFPRDLKAAHDRMVLESESHEAEMRIREVERKYPKIWKDYKNLDKLYHFQTKQWIIRPAASAQEIVEEGRALHHYVGASDHYMQKHVNGESYILMLREAGKEGPYITVEADRNAEIRQWYGAYDKKTREKEIDRFLAKRRAEVVKRREHGGA